MTHNRHIVCDNINRQTELDNCYFVKTVLMILVILYHSSVFWTGTWFTTNPALSSNILMYFSIWLSSFHIYGFTLISGYIFYFIKYEKGGYQDFRFFARKKAKRLIVPYAFVTTIWVAPISTYFFKYGVKDVIEKFLFAIQPAQLWFLWMLFGVFILFYLFSDFFWKYDLLGLFVTVTMYGVGIIGTAAIPNVFQIWTACQYMIFFWLGFKIRQHGSAALYKIPSLVYILIDLLVYMIYQYLSNCDFIFSKIFYLGFGFLLHVIGAMMAFVILQRIAAHFDWNNSRVFRFLCQRSMPMYLFHQQIIYFFIVLLNGVISPYLHVAVNFVGAIFISIIITTIFMKFKVTKFLIGEK